MIADPQPLLAIRDLGHHYSGVPVLADINMDVNVGERLVVLGPSGCGKTTLLRILSGLMRASTGTVLMRGEPLRSGIDTAMVFQNPRLLPWCRTAANIDVVLKQRQHRQSAQYVADLLLRVGLRDHADKWPHELSGGMKQRLALARALAINAPLLLLDEPFANLDPLAREDMQQVLLDLTPKTSEAPTTTILVTHSVEEALVVADRIILMAGSPGRVVEIITPKLRGDTQERRSDTNFYPYLSEVSALLRYNSRHS